MIIIYSSRNGYEFNFVAMPYIPPTATLISTSSCPSFLPSPQTILSPVYTPPPSPGHALTSPLPTRRIKPLQIQSSRRHPTPSPPSSTSSSSMSPKRFPLAFVHSDSIEILRHGKHAQSSGQPQQSSKPAKAEKQQPTQAQLNAERKEQERQAHFHQQQQQQAQEQQYNDNMGGQGLAAGNGMLPHLRPASMT